MKTHISPSAKLMKWKTIRANARRTMTKFVWQLGWCGPPRKNLSHTIVQCDRKKSPNVNKSCPKMISLQKLKVLTPLHKLPKNVWDSGKLNCCQALKSCPKSNKSPTLVTLLLWVQQLFLNVWTGESKFCNHGKILKVFLHFWIVCLVFGKILTLFSA